MSKIILLNGASQYNVMRYWTYELSKGFNKLGIETLILDLNTIPENIIIQYLKELEYDAVVAFNGWGIGANTIDIIKAPFIMILADHPIDHFGRIEILQNKDILTVMDRNDAQTLSIFNYPVKNVFMLPHAAIEVDISPVEKDIDLLVLGTYSNPVEYYSFLESLPKRIKKICDETIDNCLTNSRLYYIDEFERNFSKYGVDIRLYEKQSPFESIIRVIGRYIYSVRREKVIHALIESGITLNIYGNKWDESPFRETINVKIHDAVNFWKAQELMKRSKIVLNCQGLLKDGTHERVFSSLAMGAIPLTNETPYLRELFNNDEVLFYDFDDLRSMVKGIKSILGNEILLDAMYIKSKQAIIGKHTFVERAKTIIEIFELVKNGE